jgi:hypothetical protein
MTAEAYKSRAAAAALEFVKPGMRIGLGSGSTAAMFVELLGQRVREGLDIVGIATSERTRAAAQRPESGSRPSMMHRRSTSPSTEPTRSRPISASSRAAAGRCSTRRSLQPRRRA